ncbi:CBS domain-containing protein [Pelagicoccus sp. SDUM812003]|uniref:magnesium transporter MgtE N-terminal domain-containing protein n=1 Tax=Pelagicoccus sp. SDUM812003 TaxID=3041267 RepID=UPI0028106B12|nr:CBS domain-containing protein [Pelagicoccus sp. SDUM812003]MDQ8205503.1 CBS domain-containing protein [Pelagicoccus sp. SDUM812003]
MPSKGIHLALAFVQSQPGPAARLLEQQPLEDVAFFIDEIPHSHSALLLARMLPQYTARLCPLLSEETTAGFLSRMDTSLVAAILRYSPPEMSKRLKKSLPEKKRIACSILLSYPEDSVGAWMLPNVATLPEDCSASEGLKHLASAEDLFDLGQVFVVDRDGLLQGSISGQELLRANSESRVSGLMNRDYRYLLGRSTLVAARDSVGWRTRDVLPVVTRHRQFVGVLRSLDLRKGLAQLEKPAQAKSSDGVATQIFKAYGKSMVALANTLGGVTKR